jgi:hypothetical protein
MPHEKRFLGKTVKKDTNDEVLIVPRILQYRAANSSIVRMLAASGVRSGFPQAAALDKGMFPRKTRDRERKLRQSAFFS